MQLLAKVYEQLSSVYHVLMILLIYYINKSKFLNAYIKHTI